MFYSWKTNFKREECKIFRSIARSRVIQKLMVAVLVVTILIVVERRMLKDDECLQVSVYRYKILEDQIADTQAAHKPKVIVFWTTFFDFPFWGMTKETYHEKDLEELNCFVKNCIITFNKSLLSQPHSYDAIVFHGTEPWDTADLPATRTPSQVYIMATMESPAQIARNLQLDQFFYNMTMTYRLDSDIGWYYGRTAEILSGSLIAPGTNVQWLEPDSKFRDDDIEAVVKKKTKTAAWFVSHCKTASKREKLVEKLQKHIDVDIYGECGNMTCPRSTHNSCISMLDKTYFFYLAFENSLCQDYVTEKLFNVMNINIIPIVFSGADISRFVPPKSYIDANDFATVEQLSDYLKHLIENPKEYVRYFWWKKHYKVGNSGSGQLCSICEKMNQVNLQHKKQVYENVERWFFDDVCFKPKIEF